MSDKERVRLADTEATYEDEDGNVRLKLAELSKSGGTTDGLLSRLFS